MCTTVRPSANAAPDSNSPDTNCDDADASISTVPPAHRPAAAHAERQRRRRRSDAETSQRVQQRRDGPDAGLLVAVEGRPRACPARPAAARSAAPCRPGRSRRVRARGRLDPAADRRVRCRCRRRQAQCAQRADHQVGVAAAQRAAAPSTALPWRRQRGEDQRAVGLGFRAGHGHRCVDRGRRGGAGQGQCVTAPSCLVRCRGYWAPWRHVWTICGDHGSGVAGREDPGHRRSHRGPRTRAGPNYNVAPTTTIARWCRRHSEPDDDPTRRVRSMRWGLIPPWVKAGADGAPDNKGPLLINARAEKVATSPRSAVSAKSKRCLVPMDGWYEWRPNGQRPRARKPPRRRSSCTATTATRCSWPGCGRCGENRRPKRRDPLLSCTIITTDAVGELAEVHDRMPLMLGRADWDAWLNPDIPLDAELLARAPRRARHRVARGVAVGEQRAQQRARTARASRARARTDHAAVAVRPPRRRLGRRGGVFRGGGRCWCGVGRGRGGVVGSIGCCRWCVVGWSSRGVVGVGDACRRPG